MIHEDRATDLEQLSASGLLDRLSTPTRLGSRPGLERIRALLAGLGNPQHGLPILHVGGTSGKGSTSTIAATILKEAGYRVGLHVKPHLEAVEERFVVDGAPIDPGLLAERLRAIAPLAREVHPSWYELTVALALQHFRLEKVDVAVVEVGLGGTYDATNVVDPLGVILTNVGLDHTEVLGDTIEKIAADKAGIIKTGALVVSGMVQPGPSSIVRARCQENHAELWELGREVRFAIRELSPRGSCFALQTPGFQAQDLHLAALGAHQVANAALAVAAAAGLGERGLAVNELAIRRALERARLPGRLEIVRTNPTLVLDGAHNPDKMRALARALDDLFPGRRVLGVLAFKRGHDVRATLAEICPRLAGAVLTTFEATTDFGRGQALAPEEVDRESSAVRPGLPRWIEGDPLRAVERALAKAGPDGLVVVTGSLYLVGAVRAGIRAR
jgi:dihydrofolate synthase/folylpolyglutamate synthase